MAFSQNAPSGTSNALFAFSGATRLRRRKRLKIAGNYLASESFRIILL